MKIYKGFEVVVEVQRHRTVSAALPLKRLKLYLKYTNRIWKNAIQIPAILLFYLHIWSSHL